MSNWTAEDFDKNTGHEPVDDDLERVNCSQAGECGHGHCGITPCCNHPRFMGHRKTCEHYGKTAFQKAPTEKPDPLTTEFKLRSSRQMWRQKRSEAIQSLSNAVVGIASLDPQNSVSMRAFKDSCESAVRAALEMQGEAQLIRELEGDS